jgi:hypothetical protein
MALRHEDVVDDEGVGGTVDEDGEVQLSSKSKIKFAGVGPECVLIWLHPGRPPARNVGGAFPAYAED